MEPALQRRTVGQLPDHKINLAQLGSLVIPGEKCLNARINLAKGSICLVYAAPRESWAGLFAAPAHSRFSPLQTELVWGQMMSDDLVIAR